MALNAGEAARFDYVAKNAYNRALTKAQEGGTFNANPEQAGWEQFYGTQDPTKWRQLQAFVADKYAAAKEKKKDDMQQAYLMWYQNQVAQMANSFWEGLGGGGAPGQGGGGEPGTPQEIETQNQAVAQQKLQTAGRDQPTAEEQSAQPSMPVNPEGMEQAPESGLIRAIKTAYAQAGPGADWARAMYGVSQGTAPYTRQQEANVYNYQSAPILPPSTSEESKKKGRLAGLLGDTPNMGGALSNAV